MLVCDDVFQGQAQLFGGGFDHGVEIDEGAAEALGQNASDGGFAAAGRTIEEEVHRWGERLQVEGYKLQVESYKLQVMGYRLERFTVQRLRLKDECLTV